MTHATANPQLDLKLRPLEEGDIDRVREIEKEIFSDPWPRSMFEEYLGWSEAHFLVAVHGDRIVGYAAVEIIPDCGHLTNIAVEAEYRRKSVANRLLDRIFEIVSSSGREIVVLEVRPSSSEALKMYRRWGFRELYRKPNYYRRPVEAAIIMATFLDSPPKQK